MIRALLICCGASGWFRDAVVRRVGLPMAAGFSSNASIKAATIARAPFGRFTYNREDIYFDHD